MEDSSRNLQDHAPFSRAHLPFGYSTVNNRSHVDPENTASQPLKGDASFSPTTVRSLEETRSQVGTTPAMESCRGNSMKDSNQDPRQRSQGFSLLELLLSSTLTIILILGSAQLFFLTFQVKQRANDHLSTIRHLSTHLETLKSYPHDSPELDSGDNSLYIKDESTHRDYLIEWTITRESSDLKSIVIECAVANHPERKSRTVLYVSRSLGF